MRYATNGREAVNMVQVAAGVAMTEGRMRIEQADVEWVVNLGQYNPRPEKKVADAPEVGVVNGLAVYGPNLGTILEIEAMAYRVAAGHGRVFVTGVVDEEEMGNLGRTIRRKSLAKSSVDNVLTVLRSQWQLEPEHYDLHINFPGGTPLDGPSAGVAVALAVYSAMTGKPVDNRLAMTGELSIRGQVKAVGGIVAKVEAARQAGCTRVLIPRDNWQATFAYAGIQVIAVDRLEEVIHYATLPEQSVGTASAPAFEPQLLTASTQSKAPTVSG
jgi:Lon-like ATP-dependent protease